MVLVHFCFSCCLTRRIVTWRNFVSFSFYSFAKDDWWRLKSFSFPSVFFFLFFLFGALFLWMVSMWVVVAIFVLSAFLCLIVVLLFDGSYGGFPPVIVLGFLVHHLYGWVILL